MDKLFFPLLVGDWPVWCHLDGVNANNINYVYMYRVRDILLPVSTTEQHFIWENVAEQDRHNKKNLWDEAGRWKPAKDMTT